jgi:hypothetical protein
MSPDGRMPVRKYCAISLRVCWSVADQQPHHHEQRHHRRDEVGVRHLPRAAVVAVATGDLLDDASALLAFGGHLSS